VERPEPPALKSEWPLSVPGPTTTQMKPADPLPRTPGLPAREAALAASRADPLRRPAPMPERRPFAPRAIPVRSIPAAEEPGRSAARATTREPADSRTAADKATPAQTGAKLRTGPVARESAEVSGRASPPVPRVPAQPEVAIQSSVAASMPTKLPKAVVSAAAGTAETDGPVHQELLTKDQAPPALAPAPSPDADVPPRPELTYAREQPEAAAARRTEHGTADEPPVADAVVPTRDATSAAARATEGVKTAGQKTATQDHASASSMANAPSAVEPRDASATVERSMGDRLAPGNTTAGTEQATATEVAPASAPSADR